MLLENTYKDFVNGGAKLNEADKKRMMQINEKLALLTLQFGDNLLAETNNYKLVVSNKEELSGLPQPIIDAAKITAKENDMQDKWVFTLENHSVMPFLQYADNRDLRKEIQTAYINRCNNNNEYDNKDIILEIVKLRIEKAKLLGYKTHADRILADNMAKNPEEVYQLLNLLWEPAIKKAEEEAEIYRKMMLEDGISDNLQAYDWRYYAEKLRKEKYQLDEEILKPYFKLENVRDGVFFLANQLFELHFVKNDKIPVYHKDVEAYEALDANNNHVAVVYFDYFPRSTKSGGAWMSDYRGQYYYQGKNITPIITINCNFTKPTDTMPSLLSFDEVSTLFHEFGHGLHGMLSNCTYPSLSGTNVPRDFVELPSQLMENWAIEEEVIKKYAKHYLTGETIPDELLEKLKTAQKFNQGFATTEYLAASLLDLYWHDLEEVNEINIIDAETKTLNKIGLMPEIVSRYRSTYFAHIFSGGYSSGYYSYIWSEILDADIFSVFKEKGIFDKETAKSLKENIYSKGHKIDPMQMFVNFRGRKPKIDALIEKRGLK